MKISVQALVKAPIEKVWLAYTTPKDIIQWNAASDDWHTTSSRVDLRPGGEFSSRMEAKDGSFGFDFSGTYTKVIAKQLIEYTFGDRHAMVRFDQDPDGVRVTVEFDSENENSIDEQILGWQNILDNFSSHVLRK
jgi:uncharacterized protein YndB with AHSA1/START domain